MAAGPSDSRISDHWLKRASTSAEKQLCKNQKILTTAYTNFSVFGLATILVVGGLIIIISYALEPLVAWIQRRRNLDVYSRLEWTMNETLQLQRLAHEELGLGTWRRCNEDVPVTEGRERLGVLDLSDRKHPRLKAPPTSFEETFGEESGKGGRGNVLKEAPVVSMDAVESEGSMSGCLDGDVSPLQQSEFETGTLETDLRQAGSQEGAKERPT
ncbi:cytochrome p450 protein [Neofusicoccum parvum]|uniref:Cytochrome p450 protein n=1 Tax=Neofusicoccum parvum TaxID=310453 RepID=A0ACB5S6Z1_9PEZI|nr:cytochrome p450 protein [Neofusicoccum parvum]